MLHHAEPKGTVRHVDARLRGPGAEPRDARATAPAGPGRDAGPPDRRRRRGRAGVPRAATGDDGAARPPSRDALAGPGPDLARLRAPVPRAERPGPAAWDVGRHARRDVDDGRGVARAPGPAVDR